MKTCGRGRRPNTQASVRLVQINQILQTQPFLPKAGQLDPKENQTHTNTGHKVANRGTGGDAKKKNQNTHLARKRLSSGRDSGPVSAATSQTNTKQTGDINTLPPTRQPPGTGGGGHDAFNRAGR